MAFSHNGEYDGSISVLQVKGYLDTTTSSELDRAIKGLFEAEHYHIIVDLAEVEYISSMGWGVFLGNLRAARAGDGELKLASMRPQVYEVYRVLEFEWFMKAYETLEEAIGAFSPCLNGTHANSPSVVPPIPSSPQ